MVKNHSDRERGIPLPPHRLLYRTMSERSYQKTLETHNIHKHRHTKQENILRCLIICIISFVLVSFLRLV